MSVLRSPLLLAALSGWHTLTRALDHLQAPAALLARGYVAEAFFRSGLTKLRDWETTLLLFTEEYRVPLLSPAVAALLGTAGEVLLPVLLVLGLGARLAALGLLAMTCVIELTVPEGWPVHLTWAAMALAIAASGPGRLSVDHWLGERSPRP